MGRSPAGENPNAPANSRASSKRGGLGRGLSSLIPPTPAANAGSASLEVPVSAIEPNPYQPRATIDPDRLTTLVESIRLHGIVQPLVVNRGPAPDRYVLIAGERRWRAAQLAGFERVPVIVKEASTQSMLELALVENVVRADLSPLEEAAAYRQLIDEFGLTQASVAERVGRSRVSITNTLRLQAAPERIQVALNAGSITEGHARALLGLGTAADQVSALDHVIDRGLSVRQTEDLVRRWLGGQPPAPANPGRSARGADELRLEDRFRDALSTKVTFKQRGAGQGGTLTIHYYSDEDLDALYHRLNGEDTW